VARANLDGTGRCAQEHRQARSPAASMAGPTTPASGIERLVGIGHGGGLGPRRVWRRRRVPQLHGVRSVVLFGEVDQLAIVRLAQQLLHLSRLDRLFVALDLGHGLAELLRAHRAGLPAQATDGLFDEAEGAIEREGAAALFPGGREGGRLLRRGGRVLLAGLALVTPAPSAAAAATTAFAALTLAWPVEGRHARRLGRGSGHARTQPDLVLAVIELGEGDEALVGRLDHELGEA